MVLITIIQSKKINIEIRHVNIYVSELKRKIYEPIETFISAGSYTVVFHGM